MTTQLATRSHAAPGVRFLSRVLSLAALRRQRGRLAEMDDHLLRDIGLDRDAARREAARPLWDAPAHWYR